MGCAMNHQTAMKNTWGLSLPMILVVDKLGLHRSLSTQSQPTDHDTAAEVHTSRLDYYNGAIDIVSWIERKINPVNSLAKPHAGSTTGSLEYMLTQGKLYFDIDVLINYGALREELRARI